MLYRNLLNHRILEWFGVGRAHKDHLIPPLLWSGNLPLDQVVPSPIQPVLEQFQAWESTASVGNKRLTL